jgi:hypothetical protein
MVRPPRRRRVGRAAETAADGNKMLGIGMPEIWGQFVGIPAHPSRRSEHYTRKGFDPGIIHVI